MSRHGFRYVADTDWSYRSTSPHGLFELATPTAVNEYLKRYGYGMAQQVLALRRTGRLNAGHTNQDYVQSLSNRRRIKFVRALGGPSGQSGCRVVKPALLGGLYLPEGGRLGRDYGQAMSAMYASGAYKTWSTRVAECMRRSGIRLDGHDLVSAQRPFLVQMLKLTHATYSKDSSGRIHYSMDAAHIDARALTGLSRLRRGEMRVAQVELRCRRSNNSEMSRMMRRADGPVLAANSEEVSRLARAFADTVD